MSNGIPYLRPDENVPKTDTVLQDFQPSKDAYGKLWKAPVTQDSSLMPSIYQEIGTNLGINHKKGIFNKVTRANVGNPHLKVMMTAQICSGTPSCLSIGGSQELAEPLLCFFKMLTSEH